MSDCGELDWNWEAKYMGYSGYIYDRMKIKLRVQYFNPMYNIDSISLILFKESGAVFKSEFSQSHYLPTDPLTNIITNTCAILLLRFLQTLLCSTALCI